ncbi:DUF2000 domain-containing protein [Myceligenerans pegani]|uniref:DUF2000 domain-containing protein n=1 Tax=Myceligenerans pegani TaxID=2776917 RepID=A0ABR9N6Q6_9MICO|nr:DUF2000 domain-containing protein [Myceligenerans sp. TRM 65318]MBE1878722.1 DUF2000 domain-containing protein [Myceligenerans sp. TRM 65318]MBE3020993.1 DUF2000 domain-containing protein [Myceligenerans sp. TRM 65318]
MTFEQAKIVIVLRDDLLGWQENNVTAFLASAVTAAYPELVGDTYRDADGREYLPMLGTPVMVMVADGDRLATIRARAESRGLSIGVYTADLFATGNDVDNRAAVAAVATEKLDLVGVAVAGERRVVDKVVKGAKLHP